MKGILDYFKRNACRGDNDFMQDVAHGFEVLMHRLGSSGYFFQLTIDPPQIDKIIHGQNFLRTSATIVSPDDEFCVNLEIQELGDTASGIGPIILAPFPPQALNSLWPDTLIMRYEIKNPHDPKSWYSPKFKSNFHADLIKAAQFMQSLPDPKMSTRFRGIEIKPIID